MPESVEPAAAPAKPDSSRSPEPPKKPPGLGEEHTKKGHKKGKDGKSGKDGANQNGKKKDKAKDSKLGRIELHARVLARAEFAQHTERDADDSTLSESFDSLDLSVPSARASLEYHAPVRWLSAELEVEFAGKPRLKDAYVRARKRYLWAQAGQFKLPISAIQMESSWTLPLARRGFLHELITNGLLVGGRRPGFAVGLRDKGNLRPALTLGAFQSDAPQERELPAQSFAARGELGPGDVTFGLSYEHRVGPARITSGLPTSGNVDEARIERYYTVGADVVLDTVLGTNGLRVWLDGLLGSSFIENRLKPPDEDPAVFLAARLIAAFRFGGIEERDFYVEPYGAAGVLDPDTQFARDLALEWVLGLNVGKWKLARLGLEAEIYRGEANLPGQFFPDNVNTDSDRVALLLQAGVAF